MISFLIIILSLSLTATILLGITKCINQFNCPPKIMYHFYKIVCCFYLLPSLIIVIFVLQFLLIDYETIFLNTEDFSYVIKSGSNWELTLLKNDPILAKLDLFAFIIWLLGFIIFFVIDLIRSFFYLNIVLKQCEQIKKGNVWELMCSIKKDLGINQRLYFYQSSQIYIPFTTGIFKKKIILPKIYNESNQLHMLLRHELVHCKKHDVFIKLLIRLIQKIHWFNPLIFIFSRDFEEECEYACDAEVVKKYTYDQCIQYCNLIIKMSESSPKPKLSIGFSDRNYIFTQRRITHIMKKNKKYGIKLGLLIVVFILTCPIITYASVLGMTQAENALVQNYIVKTSIKMSPNQQPVHLFDDNTKYISLQKRNIGYLNAKGTNNIDITMSGSEIVYFDPLSLSQDSNIRVSVSSEDSNDNFEVGIIAPNGKKYFVSSTDGMIGYTFNINSSGSYTVYIKGQNDNNEKNIHITGSIYVNY